MCVLLSVPRVIVRTSCDRLWSLSDRSSIPPPCPRSSRQSLLEAANRRRDDIRNGVDPKASSPPAGYRAEPESSCSPPSGTHHRYRSRDHRCVFFVWGEGGNPYGLQYSQQNRRHEKSKHIRKPRNMTVKITYRNITNNMKNWYKLIFESY